MHFHINYCENIMNYVFIAPQTTTGLTFSLLGCPLVAKGQPFSLLTPQAGSAHLFVPHLIFFPFHHLFHVLHSISTSKRIHITLGK